MVSPGAVARRAILPRTPASVSWAAQVLYEGLYCARGDMENRIKEQFSLFADSVSAETMRANQMRLYRGRPVTTVFRAGLVFVQSGSSPSGA
jgi:hypothetical protein